jgi:PAS domain S-box-containing protein
MDDLNKLSRAELIAQLKTCQQLLHNDGSKQTALSHELQVHQIELDLQNKELQTAQQELELARDKYADLYDFSPVSYFSFDQQGIILNANLTACALFAKTRNKFLGKAFINFIQSSEINRFKEHLNQVFAKANLDEKDQDSKTEPVTSELLINIKNQPSTRAAGRSIEVILRTLSIILSTN